MDRAPHRGAARMWRGLAFATAAALCACLLAAVGADAQLRTVGADLNRPANAPYGCEALPMAGPFGNRVFLPSNAATCTYIATGGLGGQAEVAQAPPGGGIVTRVRVRTGPRVGPMQVTVARATRSPGIFACCFFAGASQPFVPAANAVTQVAVRLPVRSDLDPQFGETVDYLGLTVLAPGVPIPAHEIGNPGNIQNPGALGFFPHLAPQAVVTGRVDGAGIGGVVPLLAADILPFCGAGAARTASSPPPAAHPAQAGGACAPYIAVNRGIGRVAAARVALELLCNAPVPCLGRLLLQSRRAAVASAARPVTYAKLRISIPSGATKRFKPKLLAAGRKLMKGRKRAKAWANVRLTRGTVTANVNRRIALKR